MKTPILKSPLTQCTLLAASLAVVQAEQASLTLKNGDAKYCLIHENQWSLAKVGEVQTAEGNTNVTWTVTATKSDGPTTFTVHGGLTILNSGTAPASIGNIVVNLQRPNTSKKNGSASYVSVAANIADAFHGDAATTAFVVASATQESPSVNAAWGVNNYTIDSVNPAKGRFVETAASGALEFTDAQQNTVWAISPSQTIPPGAAITLLYRATYNVAYLPPPGTSLRVETLVTFGNAGVRGGGGASETGIDINGNGSLETDESYVRTVPSRSTLAALPSAPEEGNATVVVTEDGLTYDDTLFTFNPFGFDLFPTTTSNTQSWNVGVDVSGEGDITNGASLLGTACVGTLNVVVSVDPLGTPVYATYECVKAAEAHASDTQHIDGNKFTDECGDCVHDGDYCSFSQGGYGGAGYPYKLLATNFVSVFGAGGGVEVGIPGVGGYSMKFTSAAAVQAYLPAGRAAAALTTDLINPVTASAGVFGGQVLALKLNIALSDAGVLGSGLGDLYYCDTGNSLSGLTVRQILALAETALGGGALPAGYTFSSLSGLCEALAVSFDGTSDVLQTCGVATEWAKLYLKKSPCH